MREPVETEAGALQESGVRFMSEMGKEIRSREAAELVKGVWSDSYRFYLKYHGRPMEPGTWQEATEDMARIMKKYNGAPVCGRLMLAAFSQLEEETR